MPMLTLLLFSATLACSDSPHTPPTREDIVADDTLPLSSSQQRLQNYLQEHPHQRALFADVLLLLKAEQEIEAEQSDNALLTLRQAFAQAQGTLRAHVLGRYLHLLAEQQTSPQPLSFYLNHVHSQLDYEHETLAKLITKQLRGRLALADDNFHPPPTFADMLSQDPTLETHAHLYCRAETEQARWQSLLASLPPVLQLYWQGLIATCRGQAAKALQYYTQYLQQAGDDSAPQHILTATAGRLAAGRQLAKSRQWQASAYTALVAAWQQPITHRELGMTAMALLIRRSNDFLWAARSLALNADHERAEAWAQQALTALAAGLQQETTEDMLAKMHELVAEAHHVLAFRIAVEQQDYQQAIAYSDATLQYQLPQKWQERFWWHKGFYYYLAHDWHAATSVWQKMLQEFPFSAYQAQLLYWLARAAQQLGDEVAAQNYLARLAARHPLSYYHVAANHRDVWHEQQSVAHLQKVLAQLDVHSYRQDAVFGTTLQRAEILLNLQLSSLAQVELQELEHRLAEQQSDNEHSLLRLHLSRLYGKAENYLRSIILTTRQAKRQESFWRIRPEQLLVYYPRPYLDIYQHVACRSDLEAALLLAVSRQESAFNASARGGLREFGLMQLLPSTARQVAAANNIAIADPATELLEPAMNIKLGGLFLRSVVARYPDNLPAAIAAYNAGAEAVAAWMQRRDHADPHVWTELIAFGTTRTYVKRVLRNLQVYRHLLADRDVGREL